MKAKWIALLALRIRNGAIEDSNNRASRWKRIIETFMYSNFVHNCRVMKSFGDIIFILRIADCEDQEFCRKIELAETRMQNRARRESRRRNAGDLARRGFKPRRTYIKKQESDLLIRWIVPHYAASDAKKGYRRRSKERGIEIQHMLAGYKPGNRLLIQPWVMHHVDHASLHRTI